MSELSDFLANFNRQVGITADEDKQQDQTAAVSAAVTPAVNGNRSKPKHIDIELEKARAEYKKIHSLYMQKNAAKVEKRIAAVQKIYEFTKTYHERKQLLIEQTKGLFKILHPIKARQAQKALEQLRQENKENQQYLSSVSINIPIDYKMGELIAEDGINRIYDWEIPLENIEEVISQLKTSIKFPKYPLAVNLLTPNSSAAEYERATKALSEYLK
jgi:hypothetical protein